MWEELPVTRSPARNGQRIALLLAIYAAAFGYSLFIGGAGQGIPTIWTANAVVIGGLLVLDRRSGAIFLGLTVLTHLALQLSSATEPKWPLIVATMDTLHAATCAAMLHALGFRGRVRDMRGLGGLTAAATAFTVVAAFLTNCVLAMAAGKPFWTGWVGWVVPNAIGVAIMLPILLVLLDRRQSQMFPAGRLERLAYVFATVLVGYGLYVIEMPMRVLVFVPALVATLRAGPRGAAFATLASLAVSLPAILANPDYDRPALEQAIRSTQVFHMVLYGVCMSVGLAIASQTRLQKLLERRTAAARAATRRAQAASTAKSDFLATMSHEIRTPLNSILGFTGLVAEDPGLSPENRRRLELVGRAGRSLADLVNDLLDFAKVEAGRLELVLSAASPAAVLRDACAIVAPTAEAKGLSLAVEIASEGEGDAEAFLSLDEARLRQVLLNLLANAVKFTASGGVTARLRAGPAPGALRFEISDTGIGIAPEVQGRLFQRFSQADGSISRSYGGTGLGLAISRALVDQMGGDIGVSSALGQGATFWIALSAAPAAAPLPATSVVAVEADAAAARVLLVDDHPMNRELGQAILTLAGCEVVAVSDGAQAVAMARTGDFDVVLMDVHMPGMDGLTASRAIRALPGLAGAVPIVALTADVRPEQVAACREAGMTDHIGKPINRDQLLEAVARALEPAEDRPEARRA
ncbi:MAG: hybrid sensor histidine kinase/response regulator [Phenylobacterium zucineum]|nr:MAG: hybrid sensor histidine kinase/response regulator [Phenylobacterium zucineum]